MTEKKKRITVSTVIVIIGFIIILIPCVAVAVILWNAHKESSAPINGNRMDNMVAVEISEQNMEDLKGALKELEHVENVEVLLKTVTLRVYLDMEDEIDSASMEAVEKKAYQILEEKLPVETYFTKTDTHSNYDLEMHFYNKKEYGGTDQHLYDILVKTSVMPAYRIDRPSDAKNPDLAEELLHPVEEVVNPEPTDGGENETKQESGE